MANFAKTTIEHYNIAALEGNMSITFDLNGTPYLKYWFCKTLRTSAYQVTQGTSIPNQGVNTLAAIAADIQNDPLLSPYFSVATFGSAGLQVESNTYGYRASAANGAGFNITTAFIDEVLPTKDFQLISDSRAAATVNPACTHIKIGVESNADGVGPFTWTIPALTTTTVLQWSYAEVARAAAAQYLDITVQDSELDLAQRIGVLIPQLFTSALINSVSVVSNPGGLDSAVTVFMDNPLSQFSYTYSLDGSNYQASSVFSNVLDGSYTLYINDGFGCIISTAVEVLASASIARPDAYAHIPLANPIRFILDTVSQYRNLHNTLYKNEYYLGEHKSPYGQLYQNNDGVLTIQFRSNYDGLSAKLLDCDGATVDTFSIVQKSDNIGLVDYRDAIAYNKGNNQTGIYFISGDIYDSLGNVIDSYELNGQLPEYGVAGNTIVISSGPLIGSYVIKQVVFDSAVQANVLVIDHTWTEVLQTLSIIPACQYNKLPYEVWEFDWDLATATEGAYTMQIAMVDSLGDYADLTYNSDFIYVKDNWIHSNLIKYSIDPYSAIDYTTGFIGLVRVKSLDPYASMDPGGEQVLYQDSVASTKKLKDVSTMEGTMFIQSQPRYMVEKLRLIFQHRTIVINGEEWVTVEKMETTNFQKSALRNVSIKLQLKEYLPFANNNISVDGQQGRIVTSEGAILQ